MSYSKRADQRLRSEHAIRRVLGAIRYNGRDVGILDPRKGDWGIGRGGALMKLANQQIGEGCMVDGAIDKAQTKSKLEKVDDSPYLCPKAQSVVEEKTHPQCTV